MRQVTALAVRNLQPRATRYIEWFAGGLGVRVAPSGKKSFIYWYRQGDRKRMLTLGEFPAMSVAEANERHAEARAQMLKGEDPIGLKAEARRAELDRQRQAKLAQATADGRLSVEQLFDEWVRVELTQRTEADGTRHGRKDSGALLRQQFAKRVFPAFGAIPAAEVGKGQVQKLLDDTKLEGKRRTASVLYSALRQMFAFAEDRELVPRSPLATMRKLRAVGRDATRKRALLDWELQRLLQRLPLVGLHPVTVLALRFVLATGQRPGEVAGLPKTELSKDGKLWTVPAARYKTNLDHRVPLSTLAQQIIGEAAAYNTSSAYVFPSPQSVGVALLNRPADWQDRPIDRHSLSRSILRKLGAAKGQGDQVDDGELGLDRFVPHDLRRSTRTGLARLGVPEHVAERVLGHVVQNDMVGVYDQHDYAQERADALELWGQHLQGLLAPPAPAAKRAGRRTAKT